MNWQAILDTIVSWSLDTGIKILVSIVLLLVSFKVINFFGKKIEHSYENGKVDKTLAKTFAYIFKIGLKIVVAICIIGYLGIDTSGLAALVASLGVAAGLAVNGALSNFAGGVLIILTRPFKVDDYIEAQGVSGTVEEIRIVSTKLRTPDNKVIYLPNGNLSTGTIINYSENDTRRVDLTFSISYNNNFERAKAIITEVLDAHELILHDKGYTVRVSSHSESSINIATRVWVNSSDYWTVYYDLLETVKTKFDADGIEIPYNQIDVHIKNQ